LATENIFIVGCNRTGTSLLRQILNKSPRVCIAPETHFLRRFSQVGLERKIEKFGTLVNDNNVYQLVAYMYTGRKQVGSSYWGWLQKHVERNYFQEKILASVRSEQAIFQALMEIYAEKQLDKGQEVILGEKTPTHYYYVPTLLEWFPKAKVIQTFRDPRAIVVSTIKKIQKKKEGGLRAKVANMPDWIIDRLVGPVEVLHISQAWLDAARLHAYYEKQYPQQYRLVKFEDIINDPENQVRQICNFLEIDFHKDMLIKVDNLNSSYYTQRHSTDGFDPMTIERWKNHINPIAKVWFSTLGREHLKKFGYIP
jgi:hypothetical protein